MRTTLRAMVPALLVALAATVAVPLAAASAASTHPSVSVTLPTAVEEHAPVSVAFCWKHATAGWTADLSRAESTQGVPVPIYSQLVTSATACVSVPISAGHRGIHPFVGQLVTSHAGRVASTVAIQYVYAPTSGEEFLRNILHPNCGGHGTVVIGGVRQHWTCSMAAVTSHTTLESTTCRSMTFKLGSTDDVHGDASSPGKSIFELAQNVIAPSFARFHDNVMTTRALRLSGSGFWVAFKSTNPASRLYFLDAGARADCYTSTGTA